MSKHDIPSLLHAAAKRRDARTFREGIHDWITGFALNRGDEGDSFRASFGEKSPQMSAMRSSSQPRYFELQAILRTLEREHPLTPEEVQTLAAAFGREAPDYGAFERFVARRAGSEREATSS